MDYSAYLKRINYEGDLSISLDLLKKLQYLHLLHIPFENLDIHQGVAIKMENAFSKLVEKGRGGSILTYNWARARHRISADFLYHNSSVST